MVTMSRRSLFRNAAAASAGIAIAPGILDWRAAAASASTVSYPLLPFADYYQTNISANESFDTNAAVKVLSGFSSLWQTGTEWDNGTVLDKEALYANMVHSVWVTHHRTEAQAKESFIVDQQNHSYWTAAGLGPLAPYYYTGAQATTTITSAPSGTPAAPTAADAGNDAGSETSPLGDVVTLVNTLRGNYSSTNPSKYTFMYPRPWRMNDYSQVIDTGAVDQYGYPVYKSDVIVSPQLLWARSLTASTDDAFPSGHTNAFVLAGLALAYAVPERFQELVTRALQGGNYRIVAGMHSSVDVIGGRIIGTALAAAILNDEANSTVKAAARAQALSYFSSATGTSDLFAFAHSEGLSSDPYASRPVNARMLRPWWTYVLPRRDPSSIPMVVPLGAESILETRQPYLSAAQRREVLRTTALLAGYPMLDGPEMWGRLDLFTAADGYGAFSSSVTVSLDGSAVSFGAADTWKNDISGPGGLVLQGTGSLTLTGRNSYAGGTVISGGTLVAASPSALGSGPLTVGAAGTLGVVLGGRASGGAASGGSPASSVSGGGPVSVGGPVSLAASSSLSVTLPASTGPGAVFGVLSAPRINGTFGTVSAAGHRVEAIYDRKSVSVRVLS
jgi:autotransporter-associated beta strand protein